MWPLSALSQTKAERERQRAEADARLTEEEFRVVEQQRFRERFDLWGYDYSEAYRCIERALRSIAKERMEAA